MRNNLNNILEQIVKILIILVIVLIIIGVITVGKRFINKLQSNIGPVPIYEDHVPKYNE